MIVLLVESNLVPMDNKCEGFSHAQPHAANNTVVRQKLNQSFLLHPTGSLKKLFRLHYYGTGDYCA